MTRSLITLCTLALAVPVFAMRVEQQSAHTLRVVHDGHLSHEEWLHAQIVELPAPNEAPRSFPIASMLVESPNEMLLRCPEMRIDRNHSLRLGSESLAVIPAGVLDGFDSDLPLGATLVDGEWTFRLFAPRAQSVRLYLFEQADGDPVSQFDAERDSDPGVWVIRDTNTDNMRAWAWSIEGPNGVNGWNTHRELFADPWAKVVASHNDYLHRARGLLDCSEYQWEDAGWVAPEREAWVIYECHLRDMSADVSARANQPGSYAGFVEAQRGGLSHIRELGLNAVEFLPLQDFGNIEIDYRNPDTWIFNDWNPYERNHWGYMTSYFFAPESYYTSGQTMERGAWCGLDGRQVDEFKHVVDACHESGVAVIMDVVYNHVSQYDINPFKSIDAAYYFRLDDAGNYLSASGCGNDFHTARPMARRMILESLRWWMDEYHIDGFRFDLGAMIDDFTLAQIHELLESRGVFHTAEPWGGGEYEPQLFADLGWSWWNDVYRVDLRGRNPHDPGFLFGVMHGESTPQRLFADVSGTLLRDGGISYNPLQSVNYIESHDDHCFSDWVRLQLELTTDEREIRDTKKYMELSTTEMQIHGLGAMHLLTSAGLPMLHAGQEFAQGRIIAAGNPHIENAGRIDHNSYEKDNATNYLDFDLMKGNGQLAAFYSNLIHWRSKNGWLALADRELLEPATGGSLGWRTTDDNVAVVMNTSSDTNHRFVIPRGLRLLAECGSVYLIGEEGTRGSLKKPKRKRVLQWHEEPVDGIWYEVELAPRSAALLVK